MAEYTAHEGGPETVQDILNKDTTKAGDIVHFVSNNQEGYAKYKVVVKTVKELEQIGDIYGDWTDDDDRGIMHMDGGKTTKKKSKGGYSKVQNNEIDPIVYAYHNGIAGINDLSYAQKLQAYKFIKQRIREHQQGAGGHVSGVRYIDTLFAKRKELQTSLSNTNTVDSGKYPRRKSRKGKKRTYKRNTSRRTRVSRK